MHAAEGCAYFRHPKIKSQPYVQVAVGFSVRPQQAELGGERGIGSGEHAAFTSGQVLRRIKGVANDVSKCADVASVETRSVRLGCVPNQTEVMAAGDASEAGHVRWMPKKMDGSDGPRASRDPLLDLGRIEIESLRVHVRENRSAACGDHHTGCGHEREIRNDHFVAGFKQS